MSTLVSRIASTTIAAAVVTCASMSAHAMPLPVVQESPAGGLGNGVAEVDWHGGHGGWGGGWHGGHGYYGGYHYHNDYWYPFAAFGAGALLGGLAAQSYYYPRTYYYPQGDYYPTPYYRSHVSHYAWCQGRYHVYRCRLAY